MVGSDRFEELISPDKVARRIKEMGAQITRDYADKELVLVGILKGSVFFMADLARNIDLPITMDFLGLSSYGDATRSSGVVRITQDLTNPIGGKHVLVVEDIVDSGLTLRFLKENFDSRQPASFKIATLLHKPTNSLETMKLDYVGFEVEDRFIVGYGLDFEQKYRNLPYVAVLKDQP
ncbi:MAG TPA: hypoxanthine phosphoribosyltransferase [Myxococcota bacterium]|jgi:hypoxanthine phosphoribosyltransferase|nr:hypoxanthine phosphoribosyltransferase [Myxococcota bacterium]MBP8970083.1 hypoxanthine phosphoribosyltransferase [Myxococcota bacterium]HHW96523.1 hypoxanthine phosphoribosyltransferase [Oligoflexales bacterium]HQC44709.1 hypoxanthine phosphoribosyltransferase [Myxococcota bacterium]HQL57527.1 hypoxanthine phosphoribosyltransferase [Myxococcota bacterium]